MDLDGAPLLSVFGGKITTFRKLAEEAVDKLAPLLGNSKTTWTADAPLPGGDMPGADFERFLQGLRQQYPWSPEALARRWARAYGTRVAKLIGQAAGLEQLGAELLPGLYEAELRYLVNEEWATRSEDILWRRSKLKLHLPAHAAEVIDAWLLGQAAAREQRLTA